MLQNYILFVNATKRYQFKAKDSEVKKSLVFSKWKLFRQQHEKNKIKWVCVHDFSVDFKAFGISDIDNIHKYLINCCDIK